MGNVCLMDDGCSQEGAPVIYLVIPSLFYISSSTKNIYKYSFFAVRLHVLRGCNKSYPSYAIQATTTVHNFSVPPCMSERVVIKLALLSGHTPMICHTPVISH